MSKPWVFLIEDEPELAQTMQSKLETEGYRVLICDDVARAVKMASNQKFGCIVIDQMLKGGTGDTVITGIRKNSKHINFETPILLISAHLNGELLNKIGKTINGALVKPFDRADLAEKVKALCAPEAPAARN